MAEDNSRLVEKPDKPSQQMAGTSAAQARSANTQQTSNASHAKDSPNSDTNKLAGPVAPDQGGSPTLRALGVAEDCTAGLCAPKAYGENLKTFARAAPQIPDNHRGWEITFAIVTAIPDLELLAAEGLAIVEHVDDVVELVGTVGGRKLGELLWSRFCQRHKRYRARFDARYPKMKTYGAALLALYAAKHKPKKWVPTSRKKKRR